MNSTSTTAPPSTTAAAPRAAAPTVPADPAGATTPLMAARRRSLDSVARRSRDAGTPISRATVHNLITAGSVPRRESLVRFLRGCGVPPPEQIRWLTAFDKVYPETGPTWHGRMRTRP